MKECQGCLASLPLKEFDFRKDCKVPTYRPYCKACRRSIAAARYSAYKRKSPFKNRCSKVKGRALEQGLPFDLDHSYLESIWTGFCPVLGKEIFMHERSHSDEYAAELDRIIPDRGYVKGNVIFLSRRINRLKNNVTSAELLCLYKWLKEQECK